MEGASVPEKWVYEFAEGSREMKDLLGGKGANLAEMTNLDLPVPPGFTITTSACNAFLATGGFPDGLEAQVRDALEGLESAMGKTLGDISDPLLVSVRSGAKFSMPGMMDTVLNLGLNDQSIKGLSAQTGNERFAQDSYRRFIQMFGKIVMDIDGDKFEAILDAKKDERSVQSDADLAADDLADIVSRFKRLYQDEAGQTFPQEPAEQLTLAITAVFASWNNERAKVYRRREKIADSLGTAVNIQAMVFGNKGDDSGTGVAFTRNPATGEAGHYGEYLPNAQGEDVVSGSRNAHPLTALHDQHPTCYDRLIEIMDTLEKHYRDMCDIEFTVEQGQLWMLQTRVGKRTATAALRLAVAFVDEGMITREEAVGRVDPHSLDQLLHPQFDPEAVVEVLTTGINASPGAAVGEVVFTSDEAVAAAEEGRNVVLVRRMTDPDDLPGMIAAQGILTSAGGKTSHAAVVSRGMGKPCVCGAEEVVIDEKARVFSIGETRVAAGDVISIDGSTGRVAIGAVATREPELSDEFRTVLGWADSFRRMGVWANADTPDDAARAREFGAEGIGLCRTEHMFLGERLPIIQHFILAETEEEEAAALRDLLLVQRKDFELIFDAMDGLPVTIRLLDPPLHEFLPHREELRNQMDELAAAGRSDSEEFRDVEQMAVETLRWEEANPMLGLRGCRLGIYKPGLYAMQVRAIIEAAAGRKKLGHDPRVEIMVPLVVASEELRRLRDEIVTTADEILDREDVDLEYSVGTMIEVPRAALTASEIAAHADFFSFGTNDLTQTTWAFSRDDVETRLIPRYLATGLLARNPFETVDIRGVGRLVEIAIAEGRAVKPAMKFGVCGEHGGDPDSITFFESATLDYVSCSPFRLPIARLAAAQATLGTGGDATR